MSEDLLSEAAISEAMEGLQSAVGTSRTQDAPPELPKTVQPTSRPVENLLEIQPDIVEITFKLRDCEFMQFTVEFDRNTATVFDLMDAVSQHHGDTIPTDKVQIFVQVSDGEYRPVTDVVKKLHDFDDLTEFYYDFNPVSGTLLIIPSS